MTEQEMRAKVVSIAQGWIGIKESDGSHKKIIDIYNSHKPLACGYTVKYTDAWCATTVSAAAIQAGLTDIIPTECSCPRQIELFKHLGCWQENDAYVPSPGDIIYYDWQDGTNYAVTDNTGVPDHVGIVEKVSGSSITVIEGNMSNAVGRRTLAVNGRYIRGYGVPKYGSKTTKDAGAATVAPTGTTASSTGLSVGDVVNFTGTTHYTSSNATSGYPCKPGKAKVTALAPGAKHPYHLVKESGGSATVYGWVDTEDISGKASASAATSRTYTVQPGDSLWAIAAKQLGNGSRYTEIKSLNGLLNNTIHPGQVLKLPE